MMCGILFMFGLGSHEEVRKSLPRLAHRGPDDQRIIAAEEMALGFTRLAINGFNEVGAQPMEHGEMIGALNGEIYNYQALSETYDLSLSPSDTEILLPLFKKLKEGLIEALDGFFSGVIVDRTTSTIWTIRDHIGKKPLFVGRSGAKVFITSELKVIDHVDYFAPLPLGLCSVDAMSGKVKVIRQHHSIPTNDSLTNIFRDAVIKRLPAPTQPVAVFLSGGLDSSLVAAIVAKHRPDATYFTLGNGDDHDAVQDVVKALDLKDVRYVDLPKPIEVPTLIGKVVWATESFNPSIISNGLGTYLLSKSVREAGIKVVLGGEGADELFGGYHKYSSPESSWKKTRNQLIKDMSFTELRRLDLASMAHSIEVRCPFLDQRIRNFSDHLDFDDLYRGEVNKAILRDSFEGFLPESILHRQKTSLDVGSGIRSMVVNHLTSNGQTERQGLKDIWNEYFEMDITHMYFSSYPVFDVAINKRGKVHK
jgi:asparagine synthase (glutamine-hydrolysing)